jgi:hypothetical protein
MGAPRGQKPIVSRMINNHYCTRQCVETFPTVDGHTYGLNAGAKYTDTDNFTGGWFGLIDSTRLLFVSGTNDPWRTSQVVSPLRPGGQQQSIPAQPVPEVPGGFHASDLLTDNSAANPECAAVISQAIQQIVT